MEFDALSRRDFLAGSAGSAAFATSAESASANPLRDYMRVFASCEPGEVWYAYGGVIEIALPDSSIAPLCGVQTLIRRAIRPGRAVANKSADEYIVTTWEGSYYHHPRDLTPQAEMVNPVTAQTVRPLHFREGRRETSFTDARLKPFVADGIDSRIEWQTAGAYTWLRRQLHVDVAHPLDAQQWRRESSGARNRSGSFSTHCVQTRDLQNQKLGTVPASFEYQAIFGWLPWLLMGQRPGHLVWRAHGCKLLSLASLDGNVRRGFEVTCPALLSRGDPWSESTSLWDDFRRQRSPAAF
jgi:hypothetical protein